METNPVAILERLGAARKFADPAAAVEGLAVLLDCDFEALLLGDGQSILTEGRQALEAFLTP